MRMELEPRLAEGGDPRAVLAMLDEIDDTGPVVLCSHGDVIPALLRLLAPEGLDEAPMPCKKGSFWARGVARRARRPRDVLAAEAGVADLCRRLRRARHASPGGARPGQLVVPPARRRRRAGRDAAPRRTRAGDAAPGRDDHGGRAHHAGRASACGRDRRPDARRRRAGGRRRDPARRHGGAARRDQQRRGHRRSRPGARHARARALRGGGGAADLQRAAPAPRPSRGRDARSGPRRGQLELAIGDAECVRWERACRWVRCACTTPWPRPTR